MKVLYHSRRGGVRSLASNSLNPSAGPWTTHETCLLFSTMQLIEATVVDSTLEGITSLYNYVANPHLTKKGHFPIKSKNQMQLLRKVTQLKKRQTVNNALIFSFVNLRRLVTKYSVLYAMLCIQYVECIH